MTAWSAKVRDQFDLPLGERLDPLPVKRNDADWLAVAQQWHPKDGASPGRHSLGHRVVRVSEDVFDMHDPAFERRPRGDAAATGDNARWRGNRPILGLGCTGRHRHMAVDLALAY